MKKNGIYVGLLVMSVVSIIYFGLFSRLFKPESKPEVVNVQPPVHVAHLSSDWYPQDSKKLLAHLDTVFNLAQTYFSVPVISDTVQALVVPHAGYAYSSLCAAAAYQTLLQDDDQGNKKVRKNRKIKRVVLLAPSHHELFYGIALPFFQEYKTPLGTCHVDQHLIEELAGNHLFSKQADAYAKEHSLEVQLPFLKYVIEDFTLVPLIVGTLSGKDFDLVADVLQRIVRDDTLIIISSDFIHHGPNYDFQLCNESITDHVKQYDSAAVQAICHCLSSDFTRVLSRSRNVTQKDLTICGSTPIKLLLKFFERNTDRSLISYLCCYYTSAHMAAATKNGTIDPSLLIGTVDDELAKNSVSYVGMAFAHSEKDASIASRLTDYEKAALLTLAREVLENHFAFSYKTGDARSEDLLLPIKSEGMSAAAGAFVTLKEKTGVLRGCIGSILSDNALYQTVATMAKSAAFHDTRFSPLTPRELDLITIKISVLGKPFKGGYDDIVLGKHGIILKKQLETGGYAQALFLPTVAVEENWDLPTTLGHLSMKAGLPRDAWKQDTQFELFEGIEFSETDFAL